MLTLLPGTHAEGPDAAEPQDEDDYGPVEAMTHIPYDCGSVCSFLFGPDVGCSETGCMETDYHE